MFPSLHSSKAQPPAQLEDQTADFPSIAGAAIAASSYGPRIGGDFCDSFRANPERVLFGLLDVAGRREDSQVILSSTKTLFRNLGAELFSKPDINESEAMAELCLRLNQEVIKVAGGVRSCPAFIGCYHEIFGTLCYTNAGHIPGFLLDSSGVIDLPATGLPLGLFSHATCEAPIAGMQPGASLLLVSRGVIEGQCQKKKLDDREFGLERVREHMRSEPSTSARLQSSSILKAASAFTCEPSNLDDMTALALVREA
jgi:sigma-B regulation protein RsbU (phosphoserine phosphatase)